MTEKNNDFDLWKRCCRGDKEAWDELVDRYGGPVVKASIIRTLRKYGVPSRDDWMDIYQDVFVKLLHRLSQWKQKGDLAAFIYRVAHFATIDWLRQRKPASVNIDDIVDGPSINPDPTDKIQVAMIQKCLTPAEQLLVRFHFLEEWSLAEVSEFLRKSVGSVTTFKSRTLVKLRKCLERKGLV
jgi:RNA polymerase sigma factor (sigma-70 family)